VDFKVIRQAVKKLTDRLDHYYLNEIPPFDEINPQRKISPPSLYRGLSEALNDGRIRVRAITLWETERACVRYSEDT